VDRFVSWLPAEQGRVVDVAAAALVTFGTNYMDNNFSWRLPLILQAFACGIVVFAVWFIPESPRFLFLNGRKEEAYDFLARYHGGGNPNSKLVLLEIAEFEEGIALNGSDKRWWDCESSIVHCNAYQLGSVNADRALVRPTLVRHFQLEVEDSSGHHDVRFRSILG
jgi:hypothetical protein